MAEQRKILRAFLASPGDLNDERQAAFETVKEFNDIWAEFSGYQVELMGWEDTLPSFGRPQAVINEDLDRCDLFIGVMWKRWGSPPDNEDKYTSGFEEEFERAKQRRLTEGNPEMALLFKQVEDTSDPGDELKKVLAFRQDVIAQKSLLFSQFDSLDILKELIRKIIADHVIKQTQRDREETTEEAGGSRGSSTTKAVSEGEKEASNSPWSAEGFAFFQDVSNRFSGNDSDAKLASFEIARLRLLANSVEQPGNDGKYIGVHDLNLLYRYQAKLRFGDTEVTNLMRAGLRNAKTESVPFWYWYQKSKLDAALCTTHGPESEVLGAFHVLNFLGTHALSNIEPFSRRDICETWLELNISSNRKNAALEYLSKYGIEEDLQAMEREYDRADSATSRNALEGIIELETRLHGTSKAAQRVLQSQFDLMDEEVLTAALRGVESLENEIVSAGLNHRNSRVRLECLKTLVSKKMISKTEIRNRLKDPSIENVYFSMKILSDIGVVYSEDETKDLLTSSSTGATSILSVAFPSIDYATKFRYYQLEKLNESELTTMVQNAQVYDIVPYFVRANKYFRKWGAELRLNVENEFSDFWDQLIDQAEYWASEKLISKVQKQKSDECKFYTRIGLDIICSKGNKTDLTIIRSKLRSGIGSTIGDSIFLKKHGNFSDIELLANVEKAYRSWKGDSLFKENNYQRAKADAINLLLKNDATSLFSLPIPVELVTLCVKRFPSNTFAKISDTVLLKALSSESDELRKAVSLVVIRSLTLVRIKLLLNQYVQSPEFRYYNVIHWLDLGASMSRRETRLMVKVALEG